LHKKAGDHFLFNGRDIEIRKWSEPGRLNWISGMDGIFGIPQRFSPHLIHPTNPSSDNPGSD
jgi:hypothetical protein